MYAFPALYKLRFRSEPALAARPSTIHLIKDKYKYPLFLLSVWGKDLWVKAHIIQISFSTLKKSPDQQQETPTTEIISTSTQEKRKKRSATTKWTGMESTTEETESTQDIQGNYMSQDLKECEDILKDEDNNISNKNMKTDLKREEKN